MRIFSFAGVRTRLVFLFLLALLPIVVLHFIQIIDHRRDAVESAKKGAEELISFAFTNDENTLRETRQILGTLSQIPVVVRGGERCNALLASLHKNFPQYANFGVVRPDGKLIGTAVSRNKPVSFSGREFFRDALANREFSIGHFEIGRISGKPSIYFGYPVMDGKGKVTAVVYAALDLSNVAKFEYEIGTRIPENATFVKLDRNGTVLASYPASDSLGKGNFLEKPVFERISKEKKGTFKTVGADGVERLYTFSSSGSSLHRGGAYIILSIPTKALFATSERELARNIAIFAVVTLLALAWIWFGGRKMIVDPVGVLVETSKRLAAGDLSARAGLPQDMGELGHLSRAFDEMAGEIEKQNGKLTEVRERLGHILSTSPGIVYACAIPENAESGKGYPPTFVSGNDPDRFGYEVREILGNPAWWLENVHPEDLPEARRVGPLFEHGSMTREYRFRVKDGSYRWGLDQSVLVRNVEGTPVEIVGSLTDITEWKQAEEEREKLRGQFMQSQKIEAVGTLAGGIAHDFNNVLTGILGYSELLRARVSGDPKAVADLDEISRAAERAATLTRQLLTFARRQMVEPVNLDLSGVVKDMLRFFAKVAGETVEIKTSLAADTPTVRADRGQVEQVIMNLCLNARDAMPGGGRLFVETGTVDLDEEYIRHYPYMKTGRYALLSVSDTGTGMDKATQDRVFEPFFTTKGLGKGTGLGLSMVYGIVKQHNGSIHLYSVPGKGSTFRIYFPAIEALPDVAIPVGREPVRGGSETVLLGEDEGSIRMLAERILTESGYTVILARSGEEAVDLFRQHRDKISLVVLDMVMPRMGGKDAFEAMRKENPGLKVIFMSGYAADAIHESFVVKPGTPFLGKPFTSSALARKVREVLDG